MSPLAAAQSTVPLTEDSPFVSEIYTFLIRDQVIEPTPCGTLFTGSSSIRFWFTLEDDFPDLQTINRGFGGSELSHVIDYFDYVATPHRPREIVLYAGENDLSNGKSSDTVLADVERFLARKREAFGDAPVYYISIKPSVARFDQLPAQTEANAKIAALAGENADLTFVDIVSGMLEDGTPRDIFVSDDLHMNADGYAIWQAALAPLLSDPERPAASYCVSVEDAAAEDEGENGG